MIPAWVARYVGLPYRDKGRGPDAWDCWGGVRMVLADVFHVDLPDYRDAYTRSSDRCSVAQAVAAGLAHGWRRVDQGRAGDLIWLNIGRRPWHCGLMVNAHQFLHWPPPDKQGRQLLSCVERLDSPVWARRIEGIYRHG